MLGFLREIGKDNEDILVQKAFYMDSFDLSRGLDMHQILTIIDKFSDNRTYTIEEMQDIVFRYLFLNTGGTEDTPAEEIISFCYLVFCTNNFTYGDKIRIIIRGVSASIVLKKAEEYSEPIPSFVVDDLIRVIGVDLWLELSKHHDVEIYDEKDPNKAIQFIHSLQSRDKFTKHTLNDLLNEFNIKTSDNGNETSKNTNNKE